MAATNGWSVAPQQFTTIHNFILYHDSNLIFPRPPCSERCIFNPTTWSSTTYGISGPLPFL